ncbi:hypothetical protein SCH4B_1854 [Ruegeria sp. TrichCH4B]|nr:hypothetical protein SCH4B_1854 [Ruegeria sp. TrichCH4B]
MACHGASCVLISETGAHIAPERTGFQGGAFRGGPQTA